MNKANCNLNGKSCAPGNASQGFTLPEMLIALAIIAMLALAAQPMLKVGLLQLRLLTRASSSTDNALPEALQWLENDVLQMRGDLPWRWEGTLDEHRCLVRWHFETENFPQTQGMTLVHRDIQYRVEGGILIRETLRRGRVDSSRQLLKGVNCLYPAFWQRGRWRSTPGADVAISALKLSLDWQGPQVERIWPVSLTYEP